ncbi:MAG: PAS domain S-box protein [Methylovirgula sp.]
MLSAAIFAALAPIAQTKLPEFQAFIPIYEAALAISDLVTASLLFAQFAILRTRALLVLASGYFFTAIIVIPHALTFPGVFTSQGLFGAGVQTAPWLYLLWHLGFPLFVIAYALLRRRNGKPLSRFPAEATIIMAMVVAAVTVCIMTALAVVENEALPTLIVDNHFVPLFAQVAALTCLLSLAALLLILIQRQHTVLDLWVAVTMSAWLWDIMLSSILAAQRFDLGYYAGRIYGLMAANFVLLMLVRESGMLYSRAIRLLAKEQKERRRNIAERRRLFETSLDLILVVNSNGMINRVNPSCHPILGFVAEEMMGRPAASFVAPAELENANAAMRKVRRGEIMRNFECRYIHKDGYLVTLSWTGLWSESDQLYFFFGRDMTEQLINEDKFRLAVESSPNGMIMTDADGIIQLVNAHAETLFGYSREELIGQSVDLLVPASLRARHRQHRMKFISHPQTRQIGRPRELFGVRKDGTDFPAEIVINPIDTPAGPLVLSVITDITERKRMERMKDEFVSTVSHELRTPLTSIAASLGLLSRGTNMNLPDNAARLISIAQANSQRLVRLINDILDIEKAESGKMVFNTVRIDVRGLVEQAVEGSQGFASDFGIHLRFDRNSATGDVAADYDRLTQIVTNLISNAIKFSPRDEDVLVSVEASETKVRISVRDHGPGIPEHFKARVFEKFAQADATDARQKGGTGLGLSIVEQLVIRLGGEVAFRDAPDRGTIFYVDLPRLEALTINKFPKGLADGTVHVLICDDYPLAANLLAEQLGEFGFVSDIATTGREAAERAAASRYTAILIDLQLPDCDGISLIQQLRAQPQNEDTQIIVVSADPERGRDDGRASSLDVLDWLQKPVDIDRLSRLIDRPSRRYSRLRPRILHVDDDINVLRYISQSLQSNADIVSADSLEEARRALANGHFDLAIVDIALATNSGLDLLPELNDEAGNPIPVIVMSAQGANPTCAAQVQAALIKSSSSIDQLITILRRRIEGPRLNEKELT